MVISIIRQLKLLYYLIELLTWSASQVHLLTTAPSSRFAMRLCASCLAKRHQILCFRLTELRVGSSALVIITDMLLQLGRRDRFVHKMGLWKLFLNLQRQIPDSALNGLLGVIHKDFSSAQRSLVSMIIVVITTTTRIFLSTSRACSAVEMSWSCPLRAFVSSTHQQSEQSVLAVSSSRAVEL